MDFLSRFAKRCVESAIPRKRPYKDSIFFDACQRFFGIWNKLFEKFTAAFCLPRFLDFARNDMLATPFARFVRAPFFTPSLFCHPEPLPPLHRIVTLSVAEGSFPQAGFLDFARNDKLPHGRTFPRKTTKTNPNKQVYSAAYRGTIDNKKRAPIHKISYGGAHERGGIW